MQSKKQKRSRPVRRKLGQLELLEHRRLMAGVPEAVNDMYFTPPDMPLAVNGGGVLANDVGNGGTMQAALFSGPAHGTLEMASDGSFLYTPEAGYTGRDSFMYYATEDGAASLLAAVTLRVGNNAPDSANDAYSLVEDGTLIVATGGVLANDSDADSDPLTARLESGPLHGTVVLNEDGTFTYTPNANFSGLDGFSYIASDGADDSHVATVTITVSAVDDAPVANNDEYTMDEDAVLTVEAPGILANDTDGEGSPLTASLISGPQHGTLEMNADGSFSYTPDADWSGVDGFSYLANDGTSDSAVATVTINVTAANDAPVANPDEYTLDEDTVLTVDLPGVLGNDSDPDGDSLTPTVVTGPQNGALTMNADGSFTYTPTAGFSGDDSFTYTVSDGSLTSAEATVTLHVTATNDAPVANNDEYDMEEDGVLTIDAPGILANDTDADGDALVATLISGPTHGTLSMNADGSFTYTPAGNFSGVDGFSYLVSDGTAESTVATVTINVAPVNDAPLAADDSYTMDEDSVLTVELPGVMGNDSDPEGDALTPTIVSGPQNGALTMNADGSFSYTPSAGFNGDDSFTYTVSDGSLTSNEATVTISVAAVNDTPVAQVDSYTVDEDSVLTVEAPGVLANDSDPDGDQLAAVLMSEPQHGTLVLNPDGSFVYTPDANFSGNDSFTYQAIDGSAASEEVTVSIVVNPTPDAPTASDDFYSSGEDSPASGNVLANDFDPEGLVLSAELVAGPAHGTLVLNSDGTFTYTPEANYYGSDTFTYIAKNGVEDSVVATATINIDPINDAPTATSNEYDVAAGGTLVIDAAGGVLADDSDIESDPLIARQLREPRHGTLVMSDDGSFTYTPDEGFSGDDRFYYQANDGRADSNVVEVIIHVAEANSAPVGVADSFAVTAGESLTVDAPGVLANDTDADGDALTAAVVDGPLHGTLVLNSDGSLSYTPEAGYIGNDSFTYAASDGSATSDPVTVTIAVNDNSTQNTAPVSSDDAYTTPFDTPLVVPAAGLLANDTDAEGSALAAILVDGPSHGTLAVAPDGSFAYTPEAGYSGVDTFTYQATDGPLLGNIATVTITVAAGENTRPTAVNDLYLAPGDATLEVAANGVLANDFDAQGDPLTVELFSGPQHGVLTLGADGGFAYTPNAGYIGLDSFMYRAFDGQKYSALAAVTIRVTAPAIVDDGDGGGGGGGGDDDGGWCGNVDDLFGREDPLL